MFSTLMSYFCNAKNKCSNWEKVGFILRFSLEMKYSEAKRCLWAQSDRPCLRTP